MAIQQGVVEKMEPENGKLFVGGISWDTDEDRLKEYFGSYGEVSEAVIMRDRLTGRARGFGFVVFVDPAVAERVVMEKHMIDGRTVCFFCVRMLVCVLRHNVIVCSLWDNVCGGNLVFKYSFLLLIRFFKVSLIRCQHDIE